jgi:HK97 family phage prohead protease
MTDIQRKSVPVHIKALDDETGKVEAIVSVFDNVDHGGDRIVKGAFARSIKEWKTNGDPIPVIFSHQWSDLWSHIGVVDDLEETEKGLLARYTLDVKDNPAAAQVYKLMKRRSLKEHSFAYGIKDAATVKGGIQELRDLDIFEVGPTLKGMNPDTELLAVKSALQQATVKHAAEQVLAANDETLTDNTRQAVVHEQKTAPFGAAEGEIWVNPDTGETWVKAGRSLSTANERKLRTAMESIASVLSSLGSTENEEKPEKSSDEDETGSKNGQEAVGGGKSSEPDIELLSYIARINQLKEN